MGCFLSSILWSRHYEKKRIISSGKKAFYCILIILPIVLIQGFRYDVGTDYFSYQALYRGFNEGNQLFLSWYASEPLFIVLCKVSYFVLNGSSIGFFVIDAILMNVVLFITFDYYKNEISLPLIYFFYYMLCLPYFLNVERQGLAVVIVWFATRYVHEKKFLKFLCCILIATLFHNTAIIGITFYFINFLGGKYRRYTKRIIVSLLLCTPFLFNQGLEFVSNNLKIFQKYKKFLKSDMSGLIDSANTNFLYMVVMIAVLLLFVRFLKKSKIDVFWVSFLCIVQLICYLLSNYIDWGYRMSFYFEYGVMYAYSFVYTKLKKCVNRIVLLLFIICSLLFYFTYKFYIQGNGEIFPYQFIWGNK